MESFIMRMHSAYLECAEWADKPEGTNPEAFTDVFFRTALADCEKFYTDNKVEIAASNQTPEQTGHDFWLTRNRHGAGFWDRGLGSIGEKLTDAAYAFGAVDLYINDNNEIGA